MFDLLILHFLFSGKYWQDFPEEKHYFLKRDIGSRTERRIQSTKIVICKSTSHYVNIATIFAGEGLMLWVYATLRLGGPPTSYRVYQSPQTGLHDTAAILFFITTKYIPLLFSFIFLQFGDTDLALGPSGEKLLLWIF